MVRNALNYFLLQIAFVPVAEDNQYMMHKRPRIYTSNAATTNTQAQTIANPAKTTAGSGPTVQYVIQGQMPNLLISAPNYSTQSLLKSKFVKFYICNSFFQNSSGLHCLYFNI